VVIPELFLVQGQMGQPLTDARTWGALAGVIWYVFQRHSHNAILGTIIVGMLVYLPLHIGLGW
jgi:predicted membrane protein